VLVAADLLNASRPHLVNFVAAKADAQGRWVTLRALEVLRAQS